MRLLTAMVRHLLRNVLAFGMRRPAAVRACSRGASSFGRRLPGLARDVVRGLTVHGGLACGSRDACHAHPCRGQHRELTGSEGAAEDGNGRADDPCHCNDGRCGGDCDETGGIVEKLCDERSHGCRRDSHACPSSRSPSSPLLPSHAHVSPPLSLLLLSLFPSPSPSCSPGSSPASWAMSSRWSSALRTPLATRDSSAELSSATRVSAPCRGTCRAYSLWND